MGDNQATSLCGEHYVSALLAGSDLVVALPRGGAVRDDLFVAECKRGRPLRIQVKTAKDPYGKYKGDEICSWPTNCGIIDDHDEGLWYAFVALRDWPTERNVPTVYFVPSAEVAACMATEKGKSRTFFWMKIADAQEYSDEKGVAKLKAALAHPCQVPAAPN